MDNAIRTALQIHAIDRTVYAAVGSAIVTLEEQPAGELVRSTHHHAHGLVNLSAERVAAGRVFVVFSPRDPIGARVAHVSVVGLPVADLVVQLRELALRNSYVRGEVVAWLSEVIDRDRAAKGGAL